jgi:8-oxo-dGTP diphosphatase
MQRDYVVGFAFNADRSKLVLIRKNRPAWQAGKLNGVGGKIEADETPENAMAREFHEETGVQTTPAQWAHFTTIIGRDGRVWCYRMFDDAVLAARSTSDEPVEIVEASLDALRVGAMSNVAWLVGIALDDGGPSFFVEANYNQNFATGKTGAA